MLSTTQPSLLKLCARFKRKFENASSLISIFLDSREFLECGADVGAADGAVADGDAEGCVGELFEVARVFAGEDDVAFLGEGAERFALVAAFFLGFGGGWCGSLLGLSDFALWDDDGAVEEKEDVALFEEPLEVGEPFVWDLVVFALGEHGFPEGFEAWFFGGFEPFNHACEAFGEDGVWGEDVRARGAGEEFALAFEDGVAVFFEELANFWDEEGRVLAGVGCGEAQRGKEGGGEVFADERAVCGGDGGFGEKFVEFLTKGLLGFGVGVEPVAFGLRFEAELGAFGGAEFPGFDGFFAAFGVNFGGVLLEGEVGKFFAMDLANEGLVGVDVWWAEPDAADAAASYGRDVAGGRLDVDFLLIEDESAEVGLSPGGGECFFAREPDAWGEFGGDEGGFVGSGEGDAAA